MLRLIAVGIRSGTAVIVLGLAACSSTIDSRQPAAVTSSSGSNAVAPAVSPAPAKPPAMPVRRGPSWQYAGQPEDRKYVSYIDENSIVDRGGYRYAWTKKLSSTPRRLDGQIVSSVKTLDAYNCSSAMTATVQFILYGQDGSVVYVSAIQTQLDWQHTVPDSVGDSYLQFVCNGERPPTPPPAVQKQPSPNKPKPDLVRVDVPPLSPSDVFKIVKSSVWVLISFDWKGGQPSFDRAAQGSAIAIGPTTLLTNCHILSGHADYGIMQLETDTSMRVRVRKADYAGDRCVLEAPARLPSFVQVKPYGATSIGEEAYSVGAPRGLDLTIANGIISGKRSLKGVPYLQTTAPISPGSSGGGLFDRNGMLIGITTAFRQDGQNLNFAIAADAF